MNLRRVFVPMVALAGLLAFAGVTMAQDIVLAEAVICKEVVDRIPLGSGDVIPAGTERVFCFTRITGAQAETEVTHNWYYQGALKASVVLPVRNVDWRTWSSKTLLPAWKGEWMVEILSREGTPLENIIFYVR